MENERMGLGARFKRFFSKYKIEIVEAYMVAAVFFTCMSMGMNWMSAAIIVGIANTYFVIPVANALSPVISKDDGREMFDINHKVFIGNLFKSFFICSIIMILYYFIDKYLFTTYVEPITFGIIYEFINIGLGKLTRKR
ncbi:MAG: hypothetical protein ATN33_04840 [Epulopiscium sp. Nele67-Bin001]|nr:MAG: hypothetical protein ATN33_04840 [Epulopiscium sp. Nele67-Bin001]